MMDIEKRFNRILAIYFHLQAKPVVKAQDLADRFQVSLRTIYRDVQALENAGVPIFSQAGVGYSLMSSYKIQPILFSAEEALSFAVAEKVMKHYLDEGVSDSFSNALLKMRAILRHTDKEHVANLEGHVVINKSKDFLNKNVPSALAILLESIAKRKQTKVCYKSVESHSVVERYIEPIGVFQEGEFWYFMAYCHLRNEVRQFRLDRVHKIYDTDIDFTRKHPPLSTFIARKQEWGERKTIRIRVSKRMSKHLVWERRYYGFVEEYERGDSYEMIFNSKSPEEEFARWFLMFADESEILEPLSLVDCVKELLEVSLRKIDQKTPTTAGVSNG